MLKVKSRTDVITNSSSESFIMKIQDYEEFKEYVKTKMRKYSKDSVLSDLDHFLLINDFCVDLSGLDISMTKHFTDSIDVCTIGQL